MAEKIGAKIVLEGEREFKQAVTSCNNTLKTLRSELNLVSAETEGQANTLEALQRKHEVLTKILDAHKQKEEEIRKSLEHARDSYASVGQQLDKYKNDLAAAETRLTELRNSTDASNKEIAEQEKVIQSLSTVIDKGEQAYQRAGNRVQDWQKQLNNAQAQTIKVNAELGKNASYMKEAELATDHCATSIDEFGKEVKEAQKVSASFGEIVKQKLTGSLVDLAKTAATEAITSVTELDDAQRQLQASTGITTSQMERYGDVMEEIYAANYGESFADVADAAGVIVQTLGEMDPSALKETTKSAITLRDTFGMDYQDQMRAANSLMDNFGISGKNAYNLIVQGAQRGLNKNNDLLDTINEYSVHYAQMGVSATGFFNSLINGTEAGTFSVDKLGDAYKEFGIRVRDTADSTTEGFELLGLNADEMREKFAQGGETAALATQEVVEALYSMDDAVTQNQAGVDLFGTMWEDLGAKGVQALMDVSGEISSTKDAMSELQDIKYDGLSNQVSGLGRRFQSEIMIPVLEKFLPAAEAGINFLTGGMKSVIPVLATATTGVAAYVAVTNGATIATKAAAAAQKAWNLVQSLSPTGLLVSAIAAAGAALISYAANAGEASEEIKQLTKENDKLVESANAVTDATEELLTAYENTTAEIEAQSKYAERLAEKIENLTDQQSLNADEQAVLLGYVAELNSLVPDLNLAYDEQAGKLSMTNEELERYLANSRQQSEVEAATQQAIDLLKQKTELHVEEIKLGDELNAIIAEQEALIEENTTAVENSFFSMLRGCSDAHAGYKELEEAQKENTTALEANRQKQEELAAQEEELKAILDSYGISWDTVTTAAQENTSALNENMIAAGENAAVQQSAADSLTEAQQRIVDTYLGAQETLSGVLETQMNMFEEFNGGVQLSSEELLANMQSQIDGVSNWADNIAALADRGINQNLLTYLQELGPKGAGYVQTFAEMSDEELERASAMWQESLDMKEGVETSVQGMLEAYTEALNGGKEQVGEAIKGTGQYTITGLVESLNAGEGEVKAAARRLGTAVKDGPEEVLLINSPSRKMMEIGQYSIDGLVQGMNNRKSSVESAAQNIAYALLQNMKTDLDATYFVSIGETMAQGVQQGLENRSFDLEETIREITDISRRTITEELQESNFWENGENIPVGISEGIRTGQGRAFSAAADLASGIRDRAQNIGSLYSAGLNVAYGLASGIRDGRSSVINAVAAMCQAAINEAYSRLQIHSPSKVFATIGSYMAQGVGVGYEDEIDHVNQMISDSMDYSNLRPSGGNPSGYGIEGRKITVELPIYVGKQYTRTEIVEIALDGIGRTQTARKASRGEAVYV